MAMLTTTMVAKKVSEAQTVERFLTPHSIESTKSEDSACTTSNMINTNSCMPNTTAVEGSTLTFVLSLANNL